MNTEYQWNDCGVCLNPTLAFCHQNYGKKINLTIHIAESNGRWHYGYRVFFPDRGTASPVSRAVKGYPTEDEAKTAAIDHLLTLQDIKDNKLETVLEDWAALLKPHGQLSLF